MTLGDSLTRFRTVEFFGVLLPGMFIVASAAFGWVSAYAGTWESLRARLTEHLTGTPQWYSAAVVIFFAYLFGSVIRAFPVARLDTPLGRFFRFFQSKDTSERMKRLYAEAFPYRSMLAYEREQIANGGCISSTNTGPLSTNCHAHIAFDYCKEYASLRNSDAAARIQEVEARTRMFYGMLWANTVGSFMSLGFAWFSGSALPLLWCALSVPMAVILGQRLRFIRGFEARIVYYAYLIQREGELRETELAAARETAARSSPPPTLTQAP